MSSIFTNRELGRYSISKAINQIVENQAHQPPGVPGKLSGLEAEVDDALRAHFKTGLGQGIGGFLMPLSALKALNVTTATQGGSWPRDPWLDYFGAREATISSKRGSLRRRCLKPHQSQPAKARAWHGWNVPNPVIN